MIDTPKINRVTASSWKIRVCFFALDDGDILHFSFPGLHPQFLELLFINLGRKYSARRSNALCRREAVAAIARPDVCGDRPRFPVHQRSQSSNLVLCIAARPPGKREGHRQTCDPQKCSLSVHHFGSSSQLSQLAHVILLRLLSLHFADAETRFADSEA
jgi:hypothetical protein